MGKTYEELYGKEKANMMHKNSSIAHSGKQNAMFGISVKDIWIKKYGKEKAELMWKKKYQWKERKTNES